ncbi:hypothetical protein ACFYTF_14980 [Nocardia thailandica]|uniref:Uncharacterized protein n=1 Tax=Nocardia thailandica TaxID=257275 RepID=A0ABW6PP01_9NOCA
MLNENDPYDSVFDPAAEYLALTEPGGYPAPTDPREIAREDAAVARMMGNLGFTGQGVDAHLEDDAIAAAVDRWNLQTVGTRGSAPTVTLFELDEQTTVAVTGSADDIIELECSVTPADGDTVRIRLLAAITGKPESTGDIVAALHIEGASHAIRFPLRLDVQGSEEMPLYELVGECTMAGPLGRITRARLEIGSPE